MNTRPLGPADAAWVEALVGEHFGSPRIASRGVLHDARSLAGLVAEVGGERAGLVQIHVEGSQCEVVVLIATRERRGVGRRLLADAEELARAAGCRRLWLVTTNDNRDAQAFYRAVGWRCNAVHRGAVTRSRAIKPEIPEVASDGTPIEDEIEFERLLG